MGSFLNFLSSSGGAGAISGAAGLLGGVISGIESNKAAKTYNQGQMELAKYQFDKNLEMWNLQNQYNTPLAQAQRLKQAGLNPALMYSQGNVGNASGAPEFHMPQQVKNNSKADAINQVTNALTNAFSQYLTLKQQDEQNKLLREQINSVRLDNFRKGIENSYAEAYYSTRNSIANWQDVLQWQQSQYFGAVKQSMIDDLYDKNTYEKWWRDWNRGYLQRSEERENKKLNLSAKEILARIAHMSFQDYVSSQMMPYQLNMLKYGSYDKLASAYEHLNDVLHPLGRIGFKLGDWKLQLGDVLPTFRKLSDYPAKLPGLLGLPARIFRGLYDSVY